MLVGIDRDAPRADIEQAQVVRLEHGRKVFGRLVHGGACDGVGDFFINEKGDYCQTGSKDRFCRGHNPVG